MIPYSLRAREKHRFFWLQFMVKRKVFRPSRNRRRLSIGLLITFAMLNVRSHAGAQDAAIAMRMQEVLKRFVQETGYQVIGVGSWISGAGYRPGSSDHDMRLLMPRGTSTEVANRTWAEAQGRLRELIQAEFGKQAPGVLSRTHVYPPTQLMIGVENAEDAMERFARYGRLPSLAHTGPVTPSTPAHLAEGLYGAGADAYVQSYERTAGRLFYRYNNKVYTGLTDLAHLGEGLPRFSVSGTANTAAQWATLLQETLHDGQGARPAIKYLQRLEADLVKSRDMARLSTSFPLRDQIRSLIGRLESNPASLAAVERTIKQTAQQAVMEAAFLARYDNAGPLQRRFLQLALDGIQAKNALGKMIETVTSKLPNVSPGQLVQGLILAYATTTTALAIGEGNVGRTLSDSMLPFLSLTPGLMAQITQAILESARETGYEFAAGSQTASDLLEGIFTGLGREGVSDRKYTLEQLVEKIHTEEGLRSFVWARAQEAAARDWGPAGAIHDLGTAEAIFQRCYPAILQAWQMQRELLATEILDLADRLTTQSVVISYQPCPSDLTIGKKVDVTVSVNPTDPKFGEVLTRISKNLRTLLGSSAGAFANVYYRWSPGGKEGSREWTQIYTYAKPGTYPVELEQVIRIGAVNAPRDYALAREIAHKAFVDIRVTSQEKPTETETPEAMGDFVLVKVDNPPAECFDNKLLEKVTSDESSFSGTLCLRYGRPPVRVTWTRPPNAIFPKGEGILTLNMFATEGAEFVTSYIEATCEDGDGNTLQQFVADPPQGTPAAKVDAYLGFSSSYRVAKIRIYFRAEIAGMVSGRWTAAGRKITCYYYQRKKQ